MARPPSRGVGLRATYNDGYIDCGSNLPQFAYCRAAIAKMRWPPPAPFDKPSWRGWPDHSPVGPSPLL
jgi:hypothetical protein